MLKVLSNPITLVIITVLSMVFFFSLDKTAGRREQSAQTIAQLEEEAATLELEVRKLAEATESANSEFNREKIIRNELLLKEPGEYVVQLPEIIEPKIEETVEQQPAEPVDQWRELFFGE